MTQSESSESKGNSDLKVRSVSGFFLVLVAAVELYIGGTVFVLSLSLLTLALVLETLRLVAAERRVLQVLAGLSGAFCVASLAVFNGTVLVLSATIFFTVLTALFAWFALIRTEIRVATCFATVAVVIGCVVLAAAESTMSYGGYSVLLFLVPAVVATDIGAYFTGRMIGGPRLAPYISPNKTWSGAFGGVAWAVAAGLSCLVLFGQTEASLFQAAATLAFLSVCAQVGDLGESWLKRKAGAKDSGSLIPGHGGVLDRFDGFIGAAVLGVGPWLLYRQLAL